ncbi:BolA family transcriptional regulator [Cyanobacterium aponinum UTEX 3222]|uniref:Transcriptional regulator, BolA protein family n=3 Tax=Cyanobacterium aponinum TaxID=379064 RepID=K9Z3U8_CYAAP|nr:BolA family transcriptional regulator [Cyanobacterium aponinum]WRL41204.1 BolA family transcriptional regulator [Cyanobacterium aponinum UTEX 3222]AFZ53876.1 transcriptional regulator, BolA protein family [Cyanobacterium aponinum PCC 10605]MBD2395100.1 BolA family transcriptional regulator [Cyanobacterium aponinum FACHB-4101]MTF39821.1 BolA/IbaG family iron-sulfur metabolism protein [Cyanobacterium aponinum 0216]PHV63019.1 BolA family transcriptional regulator [Cyanobacterium aponinum IPPAS
MVSLEQVKKTIQQEIPDAEVVIKDLTGGGDHLEAIVVSSQFEGKTKVKQHQLVYSALQAELQSEAIHALALKTYTPSTWSGLKS